MHGVRAEGEFFKVGQTVVVRVALVKVGARRRDGGVERGGDVV